MGFMHKWDVKKLLHKLKEHSKKEVKPSYSKMDEFGNMSKKND
jgi:hypothetical protein